MNKRLRISIFSILAMILIFGGWTAFAATSSDAATSASIVGTFQSASPDQAQVSLVTASGAQTIPLAKSVWVYRNDQKAQLSDLKPGDQVELIMNSKQQAAYVKASSAEPPAVSPAPSAAPSPSPSATPSAAPSAVPTVAPAVQSGPTASAAPGTLAPQDDTVYPGLNGIDLKIDGKHFKLQIKQVPGNGRTTYDLSIKPEGAGTVHLKGDEAAVWIKQLLAGIDLKSANVQQALLQELADHYNLDTSKLNVQLKTDWKPAAPGHGDKDEDQDGDDQGDNGGKADKGDKADKDDDSQKSQKGDSPKVNPSKDDAKERAQNEDAHAKKPEQAKKTNGENHKKNDDQRGGKHDD